MRIDPTSQSRAAAVRREARPETGSERSFASEISGETPATTATATTSGLGAVDNLFLLQEIGADLAGRRRAALRGKALLDRLDELRLALLAGSIPRARLTDLAALARESGAAATDDPKLAEILAEIELRVAVELAKLGETV